MIPLLPVNQDQLFDLPTRLFPTCVDYTFETVITVPICNCVVHSVRGCATAELDSDGGEMK